MLQEVKVGVTFELVIQSVIFTFILARVHPLKCASWNEKSNCAHEEVTLVIVFQVTIGAVLSMKLIVEITV